MARERKQYKGEVVAVRRYTDGWLCASVRVAGMLVTIHVDPTKAEVRQITSQATGEPMTFSCVQDCYAERLPKVSHVAA